MDQFPVKYVLDFAVALIAAAAVFAYWVANRKRIAAETVGQAEQQATRTLREAERESEARRKEVLLEAKEQAHALTVDADRQCRERLAETQRLEQQVADKSQNLAERLANADRLEKDIRGRDCALAAREEAVAAATARYERLVAEQQRELQRVAGLTADEARDLLLRQIEADARRETATLVKRLENEAREGAADKARQVHRRGDSAERGRARD